MARAVLIFVSVATCFWLPAQARAHGDPVSDQLLEASVFLPLSAKVDSRAVRRLATAVREADEAGFHIKVAVVAEPADLGPRFGLYRKPQQLAETLSQDLFAYAGGFLVVTPNGYGYAVNGARERRSSRSLAGLQDPGREPTNQAEAATLAVRRLAAAAGHRIALPTSSGGSETRDRITIGASAVAGLALVAALVLVRRQRRARRD